MDATLGLYATLLLVLAAEFVNGWTDAPNAIATVVSTRVLSPRIALVLATVLNVVGAMFGQQVALTLAKDIIRPEAADLSVIAASMTAIVFWSTLAWRFGLPTSESHALVAAMAGAGLAAAGPSVLLAKGWSKVGIGLLCSTFFGFSGGFLIMGSIYWIFQKARRALVQKLFGRLQILSAAFMAFGHGTGDGQKFIGVFSLALFLGGLNPEKTIPAWVVLLCAVVMGVGTAFGGWRIIRTMGIRLTKLEPVQGFAAEVAAGATITIATRFGIPLSTTHTINTAIMGVGATRRFSAVRWGVGAHIVGAWILTFPVCAAVGFVVTKVLRALL
ncbi:MAG TPA: inorganic phosphate transporter [Planctomycetota bacterium]|nr:inorganic phosphate transporter [Planctomycetota bacterium]